MLTRASRVYRRKGSAFPSPVDSRQIVRAHARLFLRRFWPKKRFLAGARIRKHVFVVATN